MPSLNDLENAIDTLLNLPGMSALLQLNSRNREHAFEAYLFSLVVKAIRDAGGTADIHGRKTGTNPTVVVFRGNHGPLGSDTQDFAYAVCSLGNKQFEVHVDVQYEGTSRAVHEIDVSLYDHQEAERLRSHAPGEYASHKKLLAAIECKLYDGELGVSLGRTFVGLLDDCGKLCLKAFATNGHCDGLAKYFQPSKRPDRYFGLTPAFPDEEDGFVKVVRQRLRKWAGVV